MNVSHDTNVQASIGVLAEGNTKHTVMFVSPQKHTVTREGHEVRDSVSENISKEEERRQVGLRHAHIDCMR